MATIVVRGTATALSPVIHGGESRGGTMTEFRRVKAVVDGRIEMLPIISGNSIRGMLRDACAEFSMQAAGIEQLPNLRSFHLLFSGGSLGKVDNGSYINLTEERRLRELLPALSLFGGSVGNRILGGRLEVAEWVPICQETRGMIDSRLHALANLSIYDLIEVVSFTRRDDAKSRKLQNFLEEGTLAVYEQQKSARAEANEADEKGASQQMRYSYECLVAGTVFAVEFALHNASPVEYGTFLGGLALFATRPAVGWRASSGMGRVKLDLTQVAFSEPVRPVSELEEGQIEIARQHIAERREEIVALLGGY